MTAKERFEKCARDWAHLAEWYRGVGRNVEGGARNSIRIAQNRAAYWAQMAAQEATE